MKKILKMLFVTLFAVCLFISVVHAEETKVVMTVNGTEYTDHGTGWSAAIKLSKSGTETTVKLFADWIADAEKGFVCPDGGTKNGALHVGSGKFILDLNGYTLDRNADKNAASYASSVLYVNDCTFTLVDTSAEQDGKITGGYSQKGGGIYAEDANLYINSGNITGNKSVLSGGGIHAYGCETKMNGGSVTDNESELGGGIRSEVKAPLNLTSYGTIEVNGGLIARNTATYVGVYGGGGGVYLESVGYMNGGIIEENYASGEGGGVFVDAHASRSHHFIMNKGVIRNNIAYGNGGGIASEYFPGADGELYIVVKSGSITGNVSLNGNGGGIWHSDYAELYLYDCTITGNAASGGCGGGVYISADVSNVVFGGTVVITDNTAHMGSAYKVSNIFAEASSKTHFRDGFSIVSYVSAKPLNADSKIGVSVGKLDPSNKLNPDDKFPSEIADCFFSDDPRYLITKEASSDKYYLHLNENPDHTHTVNPIFVVETATEGKKEFYDHNDGWAYAVEMSKTTNVKITLYDDWFGSNGSFQYYDKGTTDGALYISGDCKKDITIDLNGHTIDRKAREAKKYGCVFYMDTYGSLTIMDSSEEKTGKITGGNIVKTNITNYGAGGAFYVDYGTLYLKGGSVTGNKAEYGGAIYCDEKDNAIVYIQDDAKIYGNTATQEGGGIYVYNGYLYIEGGEITDNHAKYGGGVYWNSNNKFYLTGGNIHHNYASKSGGGIYVDNHGKMFVGGDVKVTDNNVGNLYISNKDRNLHNACGQDSSPDKPLTDGATIYISASDSNDAISGDDSRFKEGDYKYFHSDSDKHYIRAVYDASNANHAHKLYINSWSNSDVRNHRVKTVSVKDSNLLESAVLDYDTQTITLTAHNTRRNFFERANLSELIECTYDTDTDYLYQMDYMRDLRTTQEYKVMSDNGTYELCTVNVVPEGGEWADEQESVDNPYKMTVTVGSSVRGFTDLGEGWVYATSQALPTTVTLFDDWFAPGGKFEYSSGTNKGRLYVNNKDITIDLNGNTISRNLEEATSDGQVFRIAGSSKLTIVDNSATGSGKITGGNNNGNGGAFYIDSGSLHINGGEISGNYATNGAAVYWYSKGNLCITGGVITNNLAKDNGGAVYITNNGKVYFGGTAVIKNSSRGNVYISDKDANIYHAKGQAEGVPDMPLTEGACIGIYASDSDDTISGDNSRFGEDDYKYFFSDSTDHYIRAVYKEGDGNHAYKLYINALTNSETKFPAIESVAVINSELLQSANVNNDTKVITLTGYANKKSSFEQVTLASLISYTFNSDATSVSGSNALYNLSTPTDYKVMSDNGTYTVYKVVVEWVCTEHTDENNNHICDYCDEYITTSFVIFGYDAENMEAVIIVPDAGTYTIFFVDYEGGRLENVDMVNYEFSKGVNIVGQEILGFELGKGDKIMLVSGLITFTPLCEALLIE